MEGNGFADRASLEKKKVRRYTVCDRDGEKYRLQSLNALELSAFHAYPLDKLGHVDQKRAAQQKPLLVSLTWVDGNGSRICSGSDLSWLEEVDGGIISAIYDAAYAHCHIGKDGVAEQRKNSETTTAADSP